MTTMPMEEIMPALRLEPVVIGISDQDRSLAARLVELTPAFIGGSYLTNPDTANDIDVVISETDYWIHENNFIGFTTIDMESDEYKEVHEIAWTSRHRGVNLLIVKDLFLPAYKHAATAMIQEPEKYQTRKERIRLHQNLKNVIRLKYGMELREIED